MCVVARVVAKRDRAIIGRKERRERRDTGVPVASSFRGSIVCVVVKCLHMEIGGRGEERDREAW